MLQASAVVAAKPVLAVDLVSGRDRLYLCLQSVIDALSLVDRVQALWAGDGLHGEVWTHWHTLVNVTSRGQ